MIRVTSKLRVDKISVYQGHNTIAIDNFPYNVIGVPIVDHSIDTLTRLRLVMKYEALGYIICTTASLLTI